MPILRVRRLGSFSRSSKMGHPSRHNQKDTIRANIVIRSSSTQQRIMVKLTVPYSSILGRGPHSQKREIPEPDQRPKKCRLQLLTKLSICGNKITKAPNLLASIADSSRWICSGKNKRSLHND